MKILVAGDRNWSDIKLVVDALQEFPAGTIIIHGACRGADTICAVVAEALDFTVKSYPADWNTFGPTAGPIRNQTMIDREQLHDDPINVCLVFHDDIENSRGIKDMKSRAEKSSIPVKHIKHTSP